MIRTNNETQYAAGSFNHCATITPLLDKPGETLVAFYTGSAECHESQKVILIWNQRGQIKWETTLEPLTGNPVLFNTATGPTIIYSKFEKLVSKRVEWWQWCSLWQRKISIKNNILLCSDPVQIKVPEDYRIPPAPASGLGYVGRCAPIFHPEFGYLLPLYRENNPEYHGVVLHSKDGHSWNYHSVIGFNEPLAMIQPSLWYERKGNSWVINAYGRNFNPALRRASQPYVLTSSCGVASKQWLSVQYSHTYLNYNNSIATLTPADGGEPLAVWNADSDGRNDLTLGYCGHPIALLDGYGSYPSITYENDTIHVVYTTRCSPLQLPNCHNVIKHKQFDANSVIAQAKLIQKQKQKYSGNT